MFYPKNKEKDLSKELFRTPTKEYRGAPFWAWNCTLEKDELLWQLKVLKEMGLGVHDVPDGGVIGVLGDEKAHPCVL